MSGPGRPEVGPAFSVRFPADLMDKIDTAATDSRTSRAGWLRHAAEEQLHYPRERLAALAEWMQNNGYGGDIAYALEKPKKYTDEMYCAENGIDAPTLDNLLEHAAALKDNLPDGWALERPTPVDVCVRCPHGHAVIDTAAERHQTPPTSCPHGCPSDPTAAADPTSSPRTLHLVTPTTVAG